MRGWLGFVARTIGRVVASAIAATFLVRIAIETSIPGGFRAVVLPNGVNPSSERDRWVVDRFHLDDNLVVRHAKWLGDVVAGDLGTSTEFRAESVADLLMPRLPISAELMLVSVTLSVVFGIALGLLGVLWSGRPRGRLLTGVVSLMQAVPVYVLPVFLIWVFAVELRWLPASGWVRPSNSIIGNLESLLMPVATLVVIEAAIISRTVYSDVSLVLQSDFIAAARAKGLGRGQVLLTHALRPGSLGLLNIVGLNIGALLAGSVIVELIFGIGGVGQLLLRASINRDLHVLLAVTAWFVIVHSTLNGLVDVAMRLADPRIRQRQPGGST